MGPEPAFPPQPQSLSWAWEGHHDRRGTWGGLSSLFPTVHPLDESPRWKLRKCSGEDRTYSQKQLFLGKPEAWCCCLRLSWQLGESGCSWGHHLEGSCLQLFFWACASQDQQARAVLGPSSVAGERASGVGSAASGKASQGPPPGWWMLVKCPRKGSVSYHVGL